MDALRLEFARLDEVLDLGNGHAARHRAERIEVPRGLAEDEVSVPVALVRAHQAEVADDRPLEHERLRTVGGIELLDLLRRTRLHDVALGVVLPWQAAVGDLGAGARRRVEAGDAGPARAQPFGERALRRQLDLELAVEVLALELLVLADVRRHHPPDPLLAQQEPESPTVDAAVVRHGLEVGDAGVEDCLDQDARDAAESESPHGERRPAGDVGDSLGRTSNDFVHHDSLDFTSV
jgi:hypothetical protein